MNVVRFREAERRLWESVEVAPTERWLHLTRANCAVRVQEVGAGPAVVFIHGGSNGGSSWDSLVARLDGFRCIMLDRPGCGLSDPLPTRPDGIEGIEGYADSLIADLLDALELGQSNVVATSYGGYFALRGAAAHPDRIDRILEFSWTIGAPMAKVPLMMRLSSVAGVGWLMARVAPTERAVRMMLRQIGLGAALDSGRFDQESLDWYVALLRHTHTMRNDFEASPKLISPIRGMNERVLLPARLLADIRAPVYFLWGEDDPNGGADIARQFTSHVPNAELELMAGAGHAPWMDDPDHAAAVTRSFFET
ncbi:MAG: alpha/beta hydrolase [Acidimicrobiales bacterium]|nr:MAG: alpha/beta hydrolase [Acidimicrobiales bacterium]